MSVLPGQAAVDERGHRTVVAAQIGPDTVMGDEAIEHVGHVVGGDGAFDLSDQALFGEDALDVEQLELLAVAGLVELNVRGPDGDDRIGLFTTT
ncbi:MAG TPA: hypothetical protein VIJ86_09085 [Acidimicrobiales bacterium]